jgi:V/A-type H+-transporting ATPase subunit E
MSLDTVVEDIRSEAEREAEAIRREAEEDAEAIRQEAEEDAETIREEAEAEVETEIDQRRRQRVSAAKLEAKQSRLEARRDVLADVHDRVEDAVADLEGERRETLTRALYEAATEEFDDGEQLRVFGRADDRELIESVVGENAEFAGEYDCLGGVVVEGDTTRVRVNNTFDSVLEDVWEDELRSVSELLFGDAAPAEEP